MSLVPWRSKSDGATGENRAISELRSQMDRLFDSFLRDPFGDLAGNLGNLRAWSPTIDVAENEKEITVRAEIPGIDPKEVDITVQGDQLIIAGEKKESTEKRDKDFYHVESRYGSFRRAIQLPPGADTENVAADYANGVLTVRLQKSQAAQPKKIQVKTS